MARFLKLNNWIGGRFLEPLTLKYLNNVNPYTQEILSLVPSSSSLDVNFAVESSVEALKIWSNHTKEQRSQILENIANEIERHSEVKERNLFSSFSSLS